MKKHHHFKFLTIDYMHDITSVPHNSPIATNGEWRVPVTKKNTFYDARSIISN